MTELVGYHTLQFVSVEQVQRPLVNANDRIVLAVACGKRVDAWLWNQIHGRYWQSRSDGHFFDHVQQLALLGIFSVLTDRLAPQGFCDDSAATAEC